MSTVRGQAEVQSWSSLVMTENKVSRWESLQSSHIAINTGARESSPNNVSCVDILPTASLQGCPFDLRKGKTCAESKERWDNNWKPSHKFPSQLQAETSRRRYFSLHFFHSLHRESWTFCLGHSHLRSAFQQRWDNTRDQVGLAVHLNMYTFLPTAPIVCCLQTGAKWVIAFSCDPMQWK